MSKRDPRDLPFDFGEEPLLVSDEPLGSRDKPPASRDGLRNDGDSRGNDDELWDVRDVLPDVRDGLSRRERIVLYVLHETQRERGDRNVPTVMLWGRVCEYFYISPEGLSEMLARLGARK